MSRIGGGPGGGGGGGAPEPAEAGAESDFATSWAGSPWAFQVMPEGKYRRIYSARSWKIS